MRRYSDSDFNTTQAKSLILDTMTADPSTPKTGQVWFNSSQSLVKLKTSSSIVPLSSTSSWSLQGNSGTAPQSTFIGTTDAVNFRIRTNNIEQVEITKDGAFKLGNIDAGGILGSERIIVNDATGSLSDFSFAVGSFGYPTFVFGSSGGTPTARVASQATNPLGNFIWYAFDGSAWVQAFEQKVVLDTIATGFAQAHLELNTGGIKVASISKTGVDLLGAPAATNPDTADSSTRIATTSFVKSQVRAAIKSPYLLTHFENGIAGSTLSSKVLGSRAAVTSVAGSMQNPGVIQLSTGSTATGYASVGTSTDFFYFSNGGFEFETCIKIPVLSSGGQTYILRLGAIDNLAGDVTDGAYFEYDSSTSPYWRYCTALNSVRTKVTSVSLVPQATWVTLNVKVNSDGTIATFSIKGSTLGSINTNIPTVEGREVGIGLSLIKSKGSTAATILSDYVFYQLNTL